MEVLMKTGLVILVAMLIVVGVFVLDVTNAQQSKITRTDLLSHEISAPGREAVQVRVDFGPGAAFGRHSHPGEEIAYVLEGTLEYQIDGKPSVTLKAGEALFIPAGTVLAAKTVGTENG